MCQTLFRQFSNSLPATPAIDVVHCTKCYGFRDVATTFNGLSAWNYKQERVVERDARGQLCTKARWFSHRYEVCSNCR